MSQLQERIAQFRKMANDDPENELGHFRLGQLLMEAGQWEEAVRAFRRTLELSPQSSKVYQLLGSCRVRPCNSRVKKKNPEEPCGSSGFLITLQVNTDPWADP